MLTVSVQQEVGSTCIYTKPFNTFIKRQDELNSFTNKCLLNSLPITVTESHTPLIGVQAIDIEDFENKYSRLPLTEQIQSSGYSTITGYIPNMLTMERFKVLDSSEIEIVVQEEIEDNLVKLFKGLDNLQSNIIEINVESEEQDGTGGLGGSSLSGYNLQINQSQYVELELKFADSVKIVEVVGLPTGIKFKNNKLKGSASKGGNYSLIYQLGDGGTIIGSLNVSKLNRIA